MLNMIKTSKSLERKYNGRKVQQLPFDAPIPGNLYSELGNRPWEKPTTVCNSRRCNRFYMQRINEDDPLNNLY